MKAKSNTSLEDYVDFFVNPDQICLSVTQLNQIVYMQGFRKIHKTTKQTMFDALSKVDLMVPFRSTLSENPSHSSVSVTVQELTQDLSELKWSECSVRSVFELRSPKENLDLNIFRNDQPLHSSINKKTAKRSKNLNKRKVSTLLEIESAPASSHP